MKIGLNFRSVPLMLLVFCVLMIAAVAQIQNGVFTGTVTDPQGAAVIGATLTITNQDTGYSTSTKTNDSGQYTSQALPVGNYKFNVESSGFKTATKQNVSWTSVPLPVWISGWPLVRRPRPSK
jgi:hypothetical protein